MILKSKRGRNVSTVVEPIYIYITYDIYIYIYIYVYICNIYYVGYIYISIYVYNICIYIYIYIYPIYIQGCVLAPYLFCLIMDLILRAAHPSGISLAGSNFSDLTYADDVALVDHSIDTLAASLSRLQSESSRFGLNIYNI